MIILERTDACKSGEEAVGGDGGEEAHAECRREGAGVALPGEMPNAWQQVVADLYADAVVLLGLLVLCQALVLQDGTGEAWLQGRLPRDGGDGHRDAFL